MATINVGYDGAGSAYTYTTIAAAISAASAGDTLVLWYSNNKKCAHWAGYVTLNKAIVITGGLSGRRVSLGHTGILFTISDSAEVSNVAVRCQGAAVYINTASKTIGIHGCDLSGANGVTVDSGATDTTVNIYNNLILGYSSGIYTAAGTINFYNNVVRRSGYGIYRGGGTFNASNNILVGCVTEWTGTIASGSNNAGYDGTAPASGRIDLASTDPGFVRDHLNGHYPDDLRTIKGSALVSAGVDVGLTSDIDGQSYAASTFPVGCSAGLDYVDSLLVAAGGTYAPDYPNRENVTPDDTVNGEAGTLDLPDLENVSNTDTLRGVTGGLDVAAYAAAYEASRNTAISPAVVKFNEDIFQFGVADKGELEADTVLISEPHSGLAVNTEVEVSNAPNAVTLSDGGNGLLRVEASGVAANAALYVYDDEDTFLGVLNPVAATDLLTEGQNVYFRALEPTMALSARYPLAECLVVPAVTSATSAARITELWRFKGLDAENPVVATGDGVTSKTLASAGAKMTITEDGIVRTS